MTKETQTARQRIQELEDALDEAVEARDNAWEWIGVMGKINRQLMKIVLEKAYGSKN